MDGVRHGHLEAQQKRKGIPTVSALFPDKIIVELVYQPEPPRTLLALCSAGRWTLQSLIDGPGVQLIPFSSRNNLIKNGVVLLPSEPRMYGTEEKLLEEIQEFIHRYVDLSPTFEKVATNYVVLSWLYDAFNELPYLSAARRLWKRQNSRSPDNRLAVLQAIFRQRCVDRLAALSHAGRVQGYSDLRRSGFPIQRRTCCDCQN